MNFDLILIFLVIGILPVSSYLTLYKKEYSKLRGFVLAIIFLLFPILVFYLYQKTATVNLTLLDSFLTLGLTLSFNYLALTGKI